MNILSIQDGYNASASLMVKGFGGTLTKLTKQQEEYISVANDGPYKDDSYTY